MSSSDSQSSDLLTHLNKIYLFEDIDSKILEVLSTQLTHILLPQGETLFQQDEPSDALYIVLKGLLKATATQTNGNQVILSEIEAGNVVGEINLLVGGKRTASVSAIHQTELLKLPKAAFESLVEDSPTILQKMAEMITRRLRRSQLLAILPKLFGSCDEAILQEIEAQVEWIHLYSGDVLFRQFEAGDSLYIVVSGRLQAVIGDEKGEQQIIGEISPGESIGEMGLFTEEKRSATVYALRDCDLVKLSHTTFEQIIQDKPHILKAITQVIINRLRRGIQPSSSQNTTTTNIAIVPISSTVSLTDFCHRLTLALSAFDSTLHLSSQHLDQKVGVPGASQMPKENPQSIRILTWLDEQETRYKFILYEADLTMTGWTEWCLRRADQILLVADATASPVVSDIEKTLLSTHHKISMAKQILILLHPNGQQLPSKTQQWLSVRSLKAHHHLRWDTEADFGRLARFISGHAIGLVFGGGGVRGYAHFGVFLALKEAGVPIDMIGGTSIGAVVGAQCAAGWDLDTFLQVNEKVVQINPFNDYTVPILSLMGSKKLKGIMEMGLGGVQIEDLWTNFFCVSCNITTFDMVIHRQGHLGDAIRASGAIPGILEPVLDNRNLLVDGGILNNLPGDIMRQFCNTVIAVDVSGKMDLTVNYDNLPSPWKVLQHRLLPFKTNIKIPSILDVLMASMLLSSIQKANMVQEDADLYLHPPVDEFGLLETKAYKELIQIGYEYAKEKLKNWQP